MKQEKLEKRVSEALAYINRQPGRTNGMMLPKVAACSETEQSVTLEFPVLEWELNQADTMHGGTIAAAFDISMGILAHCLNQYRSVVTVNMSINYVKPIPMGDSFLITVKATSLGKKIITVSGECRLKSSGLLTNTAIGTFAAVS